MSDIDVVEKVLSNQPDLPVHVPYAGNTSPGIASFNTRDFIVEENGAVQLSKDVQALTEEAVQAAENAKQSAANAAESETNAKQSETNAKQSETNAKSSETNAAKSETNAKSSEDNAKQSELKAEQYCTDAEIFSNNAESSAQAAKQQAQSAKIWAEDASNSAGDASDSAIEAAQSADRAQQIADSIGSTFKPKGTIKFEELPVEPAAEYEGFLWDISNSFITDDRFIVGAGQYVPAGSDVSCIETTEGVYKYNISAGLYDLSAYATKTQLDSEKSAREAADNNLSTRIDAKYTKPSTGIPKTDLAKDVQQQLDSRDGQLDSTKFPILKRFRKKLWPEMYLDGNVYYPAASKIWADCNNIYCDKYFIFDKYRREWRPKTFDCPFAINTSELWTDGTFKYISATSTGTWQLDSSTGVWTKMIMSENISGANVWTDGNNIYYSEAYTHYIFDKSSHTWSTKEWYGIDRLIGQFIWTDGKHIYYSLGSEHFVLDIDSSTWYPIVWEGLESFYGNEVWTDGQDIYYASSHILDSKTNAWKEVSWDVGTFTASQIWTDGTSTYLDAGEGYTYYELIAENVQPRKNQSYMDYAIDRMIKLVELEIDSLDTPVVLNNDQYENIRSGNVLLLVTYGADFVSFSNFIITSEKAMSITTAKTYNGLFGMTYVSCTVDNNKNVTFSYYNSLPLPSPTENDLDKIPFVKNSDNGPIYDLKTLSGNELGAGTFLGTALQNGADINDCIPDTYGKKQFWYNSSINNTFLNLPDEAAKTTFTVEAVKTWELDGNYRVYQELRSVSNNPARENIFIRCRDSASSTGSEWTEWEIITTSIGSYPKMGAGYLAKNTQIAASSSSIGWWKVGSIDLAVTGKASVSSSTVIRVTGLYSHVTPSGEIEVNGRLQDGALNPTACPLYMMSGNLDPSKFCVAFEEKIVSLYVHLGSTYSRYSFTVVQDDIEAKSNSGYFTFNPAYIGSSAPDGAVYAVRQIHASMSEKSSQNLLFNGNFKVNTFGKAEYFDIGDRYHACVDGWEFGYGDSTLSVLSNGVKITKEAGETNPTNFQTTDIKSAIGAAGKYTISFAVDDLNAVQQVYAYYVPAEGGTTYLTLTSKNDTVNNIAIYTFTVTDEQFTAIQQCNKLQIGIQKKQDYNSLIIYYAKLEEGEISTAPNSIVNNATNAQIANIAKRLSNISAIGSSTQPVYFSADGVPVACDNKEISITVESLESSTTLTDDQYNKICSGIYDVLLYYGTEFVKFSNFIVTNGKAMSITLAKTYTDAFNFTYVSCYIDTDKSLKVSYLNGSSIPVPAIEDEGKSLEVKEGGKEYILVDVPANIKKTISTMASSVSMVPYGGQATTLSSLASGGVYSISANGYLRIAYQTTAADNFINMKQVDSEGADIWGALSNGQKSYGSGYPIIYMPVAKGDHIKVDFSSSVKIIQVQLIKVKIV